MAVFIPTTTTRTSGLEPGGSTLPSVARTPAVRLLPRGLPRLGGAALIGLLAAGHLASDIPFAAVSALLPTIQDRFGLTESVLALLVATLSFAASVTQPLFGALADRIGPRLVGAAGMVSSSVLLALVGVAPSLWLLFGLLLTGGLASAAMHPAFIGLSRRNGGSRPSLAVSLYSAAGTLGVAIGPVAVMTVMSTVGVSGTPWLMLPGVVLGIAAYFAVPAEIDRGTERASIIDRQLIAAPVLVLTLAAVLASVPFVAFSAGIGLWLVAEHGVARDAALIGATLSAFSFAAALGGVIAGVFAAHVSARVAVSATMLGAAVPLFAILALEPGSAPYYTAVLAAGALLNASLPIMVVTAQNLVPGSVAAASGVVLGLAHGLAGLLYVGVGHLQEAVGTGAALAASYLLLVPAAVTAFLVLTKVSHSRQSGREFAANAACASPTLDASPPTLKTRIAGVRSGLSKVASNLLAGRALRPRGTSTA